MVSTACWPYTSGVQSGPPPPPILWTLRVSAGAGDRAERAPGIWLGWRESPPNRPHQAYFRANQWEPGKRPRGRDAVAGRSQLSPGPGALQAQVTLTSIVLLWKPGALSRWPRRTLTPRGLTSRRGQWPSGIELGTVSSSTGQSCHAGTCRTEREWCVDGRACGVS